ncbi:hypothetical protein NEUTE2DRAFT_60481 [Neurospora tetrasperma FGSC 2509]|nr:hypothetical protein NEUTE2DRAFT_60481 [Neurospora tetrasperma FGSC 2509]
MVWFWKRTSQSSMPVIEGNLDGHITLTPTPSLPVRIEEGLPFAPVVQVVELGGFLVAYASSPGAGPGHFGA